MHFSFKACHDHPVDERMAQYAWGRDCEHRLDVSRARMARAKTLSSTYQRFDGPGVFKRAMSLP